MKLGKYVDYIYVGKYVGYIYGALMIGIGIGTLVVGRDIGWVIFEFAFAALAMFMWQCPKSPWYLGRPKARPLRHVEGKVEDCPACTANIARVKELEGEGDDA